MIKVLFGFFPLLGVLQAVDLPLIPERPAPIISVLDQIDPAARTVELTKDSQIDFHALAEMPQLEHLILNYGGTWTDPLISEEEWHAICALPIKTLALNIRPTYANQHLGFSFQRLSPTLETLLITYPEIYTEQQLKELNELGVNLILHGRLYGYPQPLQLLDQAESLTLVQPYYTYADITLSHTFLPRLKYFRLAVGSSTHEQLKQAQIKKFAPNLIHLDLRNSDFSDEATSHLIGMQYLEEILLKRTQVTSKSIPLLAQIPSLKRIDLSGNALQGADFALFNDLHNLEILNLSGSTISSGEIKSLSGLKQLKQLHLNELKDDMLNGQEIEDLIQALPNCLIIY